MSGRRLAAALVVLAACGDASSSKDQIRVAMASDLALAFEEIGKEFKSKTGIEPVFSPGSSGQLATQIAEGAPFDLFAAASAEYVDKVVSSGACDGASRALYARGRIVMWSKGQAPARLEDLADPRWSTIAIANELHAPYGKAAMQAMQKAGVWDQVQDRLVRGENILDTMRIAKTGNADVALVALSLAVVADGGSSTPIDPSLHDPLDQELVVCGNRPSTDGARKFAAFLASSEGREVMTRYGFTLPSP